MSFEIQNQVRQKTMQVHESIKGLKEFEAEMKKKELELKNQAEQKLEEQSSNVRFVDSLSWKLPLIRLFTSHHRNRQSAARLEISRSFTSSHCRSSNR